MTHHLSINEKLGAMEMVKEKKITLGIDNFPMHVIMTFPLSPSYHVLLH